MEPVSYRISLNMNRDTGCVSLGVKLGDTARRIYISLVEDGKPYTIVEGCYAVFSGRKPDGTPLFNNCVIDRNTIIYDLTPQTTNVKGRVKCEIRLYCSDDRLITSSDFEIIVHDTVLNPQEDIGSVPQVGALDHLISEATEKIAELVETTQDGEDAAKEANQAAEDANRAAATATAESGRAGASAEAADKATQNATEAATSANAAAEAATNAAASANDAQVNAQAAAQAAQEAAQWAENQAKIADQAAASANAAAENANTSASEADNAADGANNAATAANQGAKAATNAALASTSAAERADQAASTANTQAERAGVAADAADVAAQRADTIAEELENREYALIDDTKAGSDAWSGRNTVDRLCPAFTESGAVVSCEPVEGYHLGVVTQIEPVQAGEGDPYPPGGGKNLFNDIGWFETRGFMKQSDGSWYSNSKTVNMTCWTNTAKQSGTVYLTAIFKTEVSTNPLYFIAYYTDGTTLYSNSFSKPTDYAAITLETDPEKTVDYIKWTYGNGGDYYIKGVVISFEDGEYAPYSNIRPITGWTGAKLHRGGKNLFDDVAWFESHGFTPQTDGSWLGTVVSETIFTNAAKIPGSLYVTAIVETTVSRQDPVPAYTVVYYTDGTDEVCFRVCDVSGFTTLNFRTNPNKTVDRIQWTYGGKGVYYTKGVQISFVDDEYEPYKASDTFTLELGQTVYGGSLDWASGVLTVDKALLTLTGTEAWSNSDINMNVRVRIAVADIKCTLTNSSIIHAICSHYQPVSADGTYLGRVGFSGHASTRSLYFSDGEHTADVEIWKAFLAEQYAAGTPVQVCYPMVNPVTVQLTPQEVLALSGINTLYSDTGDTEVSGRADPVTVITDLKTRIAALETAVISNT